MEEHSHSEELPAEPSGKLDVPYVAGGATSEDAVNLPTPEEESLAAQVDTRLPSRNSLVAAAVFFEGGLALVALALGWLFGLGIWSQLRLDSVVAIQQALLWGVLGTIPPVLSLWLLDHYPIGPYRGLKKFVEEQVAPLFRGGSLWQFVVIAVAAGLGEELLCRGFLQTGLQVWLTEHVGATAATVTALVIASVVFGLAHYLTTAYAISCIVIGFYLGGIFIATENLLVPVIVHALYDFVALIYLTRK